jgi:two-component system, NarL family, nitrate/nitrite response regulator NarL
VRLVLGDDQRLFIDALAVALGRHGVTVAALATSGEEVLSAVGRYRPDICLLDAGFPGSSGLDVLPTMRRQYPGVKVVMLSASSDPQIVSASMKYGAAGFLRKDQEVAKIVGALALVQAGEHVVDDDLLRTLVRQFGPRAGGEQDWLLTFLTSREHEVLMRMMEGECTKQIARSLAIAQSTARTHAQNVLAKLGVHSRLEAATMVAQAGMTGGSARHYPAPSARAAGGS